MTIAETRDKLTLAEQRARVTVLEEENDILRQRLGHIFDRIAAGEQVALRYPDGKLVTITRAKQRGGGEAA